jgi:hypothetical protein
VSLASGLLGIGVPDAPQFFVHVGVCENRHVFFS